MQALAAITDVSDVFEIYQWESIPDVVVTAENHVMDTSSEDWDIPYIQIGSATARFSSIKSIYARTALKLYCMDRARAVSSHAAWAMYADCSWLILGSPRAEYLDEGLGFKENLKNLFNDALASARKDKNLSRVYRVVRWYVWCSENYAELGFCEDFALELDLLRIPGNAKGEAVRNEEVDSGPLHRTLELQQLINAMKLQTDRSLKQLQERAALALFIAHGRNPANLSRLLEEDLVDLTPESKSPTWVLRYPRIKKRQKDPRSDMRQVPIPTEYAGYLLDLIEKNKTIDCTVNAVAGLAPQKKPLFINRNINKAALRVGQYDKVFCYPTYGITGLLRSFVRRHEIYSPLTKRPLIISARRLRYTLATNLVIDGVSRRQLAYILDHSDTQNVEVYFELAGEIVRHLDKALDGYYTELSNFFKGRIVRDGDEIINSGDPGKLIPVVQVNADIGVCGQNSLCDLAPPYSCYKCPKFQAFFSADHQSVYDHLMKRRGATASMGDKKMVEQLYEIICAVKEVIEKCARLANGDSQVYG